ELDLRLPAGAGPHPVALVLHGGFWRAPFTRRNTSAVSAALTRAGWASANVEYRRLGPGGYAATLADVAAARTHLDTLDASLDLRRTMAIGHSAGGHLALWLAATGRVSSVVALAGVCDLEDAARAGLGQHAVQEFLGGEPSEAPKAYAAADPARRLPLGVPQLLVHGTADDRVPFAHAERYAERARAAGDDCSLLALDGVDHFDVIDPRTEAWRAIGEALRP
ncbi:MAG TPA: prolyl oligopeptidase family serine peptidase, partial [Gaiellaceae bacterium]|nr:prolyl oligopeptidase family serine peptidase [Gaiellaceae bacterium]